MKNILHIFILLSSVIISAQTSNLTVFSEEGTPFYLILNGVRQNANPQTNICVNGLTNSYYTTKIIFSNQNMPVLEKKYLMVVDANGHKGEATYKIHRKKNGKLVLHFYSFTPAFEIMPPPQNVQVVTYNTNPMPNIIYSETTTTTTSTTGGGNIHNSNQSEVVYVDDYTCYPMEPERFYYAIQSIKNKNFSDTQLTLAKQITNSNCLTVLQLKEIANIFSFEETKLEFAKYAYHYCYDPENYWQMNDIFSFESTTDELNKYINGR